MTIWLKYAMHEQLQLQDTILIRFFNTNDSLH